jgi:hypothetical protein
MENPKSALFWVTPPGSLVVRGAPPERSLLRRRVDGATADEGSQTTDEAVRQQTKAVRQQSPENGTPCGGIAAVGHRPYPADGDRSEQRGERNGRSARPTAYGMA